MVVSVPVRPVNWTRPSSRGALILQAIMPLRENRVWPSEISGFRPSQDIPYMVKLSSGKIFSVHDFLLSYYYYLQTYLKPNMDYKHIREQLALQKQSTRRGLSKFLAKTRPSRILAGNPDSAGSISCESY